MRFRSDLLCAGALLSFLSIVSPADASPEYGPAIPNGDETTATCIYCHTAPPARNVFGDAVLPYTPANLAALWPALCDLDSDNDGVTNGEELGDPCCVWTMGGPAPQEAIASNPGDPADAVATVCDPAATGSTSSAGSGGTTGATGGTGAGAGGPGPSEGAGLAKPPPPISQGACALGASSSVPASPSAWLGVALGVTALALSRRTSRRR